VAPEPLVAYLLELADDELLLGHRHSEWTAFAPTIEEDVAFASIAQDEIGHARLFLAAVAERTGEDPDRLAFLRGADARRNAVLVELPNRDWAFSIARQALYDLADDVRTEALLLSPEPVLRQTAALIRREERYHLEHGRLWVDRLLAGSGESRGRMATALAEVAPQAAGVLMPTDAQAALHDAGVLPVSGAELVRRFQGRLAAWLGAEWAARAVPSGDRAGEHTPHLAALLDQMSEVLRLDPEAAW
jgi:ring-1,2-phenylacetyl-CoA epoxidase subunit PaaC